MKRGTPRWAENTTGNVNIRKHLGGESKIKKGLRENWGHKLNTNKVCSGENIKSLQSLCGSAERVVIS